MIPCGYRVSDIIINTNRIKINSRQRCEEVLSLEFVNIFTRYWGKAQFIVKGHLPGQATLGDLFQFIISPFPILERFNSVRLMWSGASESGLIRGLEQPRRRWQQLRKSKKNYEQDDSARASCLAFCCISFTSTARPLSTFLLNVTVLWRTWILDVELSFLFWDWI